MYEFFLYIHSYLRWAVLILALVVIVRGFMGWQQQKAFVKADNAISASFVGFMHLQLLLGLLLYFVFSPLGLQAFDAGVGAVMKNGAVRYWAVEHITTMIIAIVIAQVGRIRIKKSVTDLAKHKNSFIFSLVAIILVLSRIPWDSVRLFRGF
ncbi:MAG: hypothetical protein JJT94_04745 [Bernardetiaceae bacterium]|nr:hypothetical protein [Bernardetiaceae bacterium]